MPARAIQMQKDCMSTVEIAASLGVSVGQVGVWFRDLGYDPAAYHVDAIAEMVTDGVGFYAALTACGLTPGGGQRGRVAETLRERGIYYRRQYPKSIKREPDTRPRCLNCQILLEDYDPDDAEQQGWQNGTRDGLYCTKCESIVNNGGGWLGRLPLVCSEDAEVNVGEALRYA